MTSKTANEKGQKDEDDIDVDDLLTQLSAEELEMLSKEVDPDDQFIPPDQRSNYHCDRKATGKMDKKHLNDHISKMAMEIPDQPENVPFTSKKDLK
ncbi:Tropomodulin-1-like protein [Daphnia magna]|uniref:Tropomodulin-1-like protein n=1 Tax=Daphnia magna TaxID=35525 RepID=A0A162RDE1_9CRUS|nr:Tropomodulin-1-like protein [Daphnia magna]